MTGTEQLAQILLPTTGIGGSVIITNILKIDTANLKDTTIQLTIVNLKQSTIPRHSDRNHFPIYSLNSFIDVEKKWYLGLHETVGKSIQHPC